MGAFLDILEDFFLEREMKKFVLGGGEKIKHKVEK
jgi:hypothetical protein